MGEAPFLMQGSQYDKEKIFFEVNDTIPDVGAQIGVIAAETWAQALARARAVKQWYSMASPAVISPKDARRQGLTVSKAQVELTQSSGVAERSSCYSNTHSIHSLIVHLSLTPHLTRLTSRLTGQLADGLMDSRTYSLTHSFTLARFFKKQQVISQITDI